MDARGVKAMKKNCGNCAGSLPLAKACMKLKRNAICIEISKESIEKGLVGLRTIC